MVLRTRHLLAALLALGVGATRTQKLQAAPDGMPMADYLGLLEQIAPAARRGAEAYLEAHRRKCGRTPDTAELRLAMARDGGDPTLMGMIRASQLQDAQGVAALARAVACRGPR